jgi:putative Holliday junction resolvase
MLETQAYFPDIASFRVAIPETGRLMALDLGEKTIGLALSDALRIIATPWRILTRGKFARDAQTLADIARQEEIKGLVLGYPVNMDGSEGPRCQATRQFARSLLPYLALPLLLADERMSTMAVTRTMLEADLSRQRRKELVDKLAAAYILQGVLDGMR